MMMPFQTTHSGRRKAIVQSRESNHSHSSRMGYRIFRYCEVHKFSRFSHFIHNRDKDFGPIFIRVRFRRILRSSLFAFLLRIKLSGQAGDSHFKDDERWALLASYNTVTRITSDPTSLSRELFTISSVRGECMRDYKAYSFDRWKLCQEHLYVPSPSVWRLQSRLHWTILHWRKIKTAKSHRVTHYCV